MYSVYISASCDPSLIKHTDKKRNYRVVSVLFLKLHTGAEHSVCPPVEAALIDLMRGHPGF